MENDLQIFILDKNDNSRSVLKSYIEEMQISCHIEIEGNYSQGVEKIKNCKKAPIVFVDISDLAQNVCETIETIKLFTPKIVITSSDYSTDTIIRAMRMGAKEFLPKPVLKNDLKRVFTILTQKENMDDNSASKIITVYSNKGGIGKTIIATNLAYELVKTTGDKVALVDLNLQLGDVSTVLNLNTTFDVAYVINNLTDKKEDVLINAFEKYKNTNLYILADPSYIEQSESISPQQIESLFKTLKRTFPYIVVDMSSNIDPNSLKILDKSDMILFTTIINIPAIRNAQRCLNLFRSRKYPKNRVKIVINRYMENDEIKTEDIENTLGEKIYWKIPNNYFSIMESINRGVPVSEVNSSSNIANSFRDLASKISDDIIEQTILAYRGFD